MNNRGRIILQGHSVDRRHRIQTASIYSDKIALKDSIKQGGLDGDLSR